MKRKRLGKEQRATLATVKAIAVECGACGMDTYRDRIEVEIQRAYYGETTAQTVLEFALTYIPRLNEFARENQDTVVLDAVSSTATFSSKVTDMRTPRTNYDVKPKSGKKARIAKQHAIKDIQGVWTKARNDEGKKAKANDLQRIEDIKQSR